MSNEITERVYPSKYFRGRQKKGDAWKKLRRPGVVEGKSELEAEAELHAARIMRAVKMQERAAAPEAVINAVELRVIEDVERLPTEFETSPFVDGEALKGAEIEVEAARQVKGVTSDVAESKPARR